MRLKMLIRLVRQRLVRYDTKSSRLGDFLDTLLANPDFQASIQSFKEKLWDRAKKVFKSHSIREGWEKRAGSNPGSTFEYWSWNDLLFWVESPLCIGYQISDPTTHGLTCRPIPLGLLKTSGFDSRGWIKEWCRTILKAASGEESFLKGSVIQKEVDPARHWLKDQCTEFCKHISRGQEIRITVLSRKSETVTSDVARAFDWALKRELFIKFFNQPVGKVAEKLKSQILFEILDQDVRKMVLSIYGMRKAGSEHYLGVKNAMPILKETHPVTPGVSALIASMCEPDLFPTGVPSLAQIRDRFKRAGLSKGAWKYLCKLSPMTGAHLARIFPAGRQIFPLEPLTQAATNMAASGVRPKYSTFYALNAHAPMFREILQHNRVDIPRVLRTLFLEGNLRKRVKKTLTRPFPFVAYTEFGRTCSPILDWVAQQVLGPDQRNLDFHGLQIGCQRWHENLARVRNAEHLRIEHAKWGHLTWDSVLYSFEHKDYPKFKAHCLLTGEEMIKEGAAMHHCVAGYTPSCRDGRCRIFSIRDKQGLRLATLELRIENGKVKVGQNYGPCNQMVGEELEKFGDLICQTYQQLLPNRDNYGLEA